MQRVLIPGTQERDDVANAQRLPQILEAHHLVVLADAVGVATDDGDAQPLAHLGSLLDDEGDRPQQVIDALQRLDTTDEKDDAAVRAQPDIVLGQRCGNGMETAGIHPGRDDANVGGFSPVELHELLPFSGRGGHQRIGRVHDFRLDGDPARGLPLLGALRHSVLHLAQRVEHVHDRHTPWAPSTRWADRTHTSPRPAWSHFRETQAQLLCHCAREPVMAVQHVIVDAVGLHLRQHAVRELVEVVVHQVLVVRVLRASREVHHPRSVAQPVADSGQAGVL